MAAIKGRKPRRLRPRPVTGQSRLSNARPPPSDSKSCPSAGSSNAPSLNFRERSDVDCSGVTWTAMWRDDHLEQADRQVAEAKQRIARQRELIATLELTNHPTE